MRSYLPNFEVRTMKSLSDTLELMAREPHSWKPFAGGTDLMVLLIAGLLPHKKYVNLWNLGELRGIEENNQCVTLGALTTYSDILDSRLLRTEFPLLCQAASVTGAVAIQNRGTLGGNIVNASPAADSPPALLVYEAQLELSSSTSQRLVPYSDFHTGYRKTVLRGDELLTRIRLPRDKKPWRGYYRKVGTRRAQAISKVCLAGLGEWRGTLVRDTRIAVGSVAPIPMRCFGTESYLRGKEPTRAVIAKAREILVSEISPIDDFRSSAKYRTVVIQNCLEEFLTGSGSCGTG